MLGLGVVILFFLVGLYAPFLASSKPLVVVYDGSWYFPLFRYLFYPDFYTKPIDLFFNLLMFVFPFGLLTYFWNKKTVVFWIFVQAAGFLVLYFYPIRNPESSRSLAEDKEAQIQKAYKEGRKINTWDFELAHLNPYARLDLLIDYLRFKKHNDRILSEVNDPTFIAYTPFHLHEMQQKNPDKERWIKAQLPKISLLVMPLLREFHWEEDAGGDQNLNQRVPWWDVTRVNRKDFVSALLFGIRISLTVGLLSIAIALVIGVPIGALAGYYAGSVDIAVSRLLEIWEAMPTFFMLLLVVAMTQSKSIFLVILIIGLFGWTGFSRYIRGEFFKQRKLPYVEACFTMGFSDTYTMFKHILPNAAAPVLTLLPFAILGAISSEAGLSFLGLGEEGSSSWGVLMDEGRQAFPGEADLLWPPAILLTVLLIAIALIGDALRDALDPKMRS